MDKISVNDKISTGNLKKRKRWGLKKYLHEFPPKRWYRSEFIGSQLTA